MYIPGTICSISAMVVIPSFFICSALKTVTDEGEASTFMGVFVETTSISSSLKSMSSDGMVDAKAADIIKTKINIVDKFFFIQTTP